MRFKQTIITSLFGLLLVSAKPVLAEVWITPVLLAVDPIELRTPIGGSLEHVTSYIAYGPIINHTDFTIEQYGRLVSGGITSYWGSGQPDVPSVNMGTFRNAVDGTWNVKGTWGLGSHNLVEWETTPVGITGFHTIYNGDDALARLKPLSSSPYSTSAVTIQNILP